jgi:hypothetical protein
MQISIQISIPAVFTRALLNPFPLASIKIRAAQIKPAHLTTQFATLLFQLRRTVRTKPLRMKLPSIRSSNLLRPIFRNLVPLAQAHWRNILPPTAGHK